MKIGLTIEEVRMVENVKLPIGSPVDHARNVWLFAFYFAGVRVSDVLKLKWSNFKDGRLHYTMGKNDKPGSLKISDRATKILAIYKPLKDESGLIFTDLRVVKDFNDKYEVQRKSAFAVSRLNKNLKKVAEIAEINKTLSMHIARHTFGNISGDKISIQMLQKLYRHSSIITTIGYQANFIHKDADAALDAVIGF